MENIKINSLFDSGIWTNHDFVFEALWFFEQAKQLKNKFEARRIELNDEIQETDVSLKKSYIAHLMTEQKDQLNALCIATQIFCCMAVEAFLNSYGVKRTGEEFYKRNI